MAKKVYQVQLTDEEREHLSHLISRGEDKARKLTRARILLKADENWTDKQISAALDVGLATVPRIRKRYAEGGLTHALEDKSSTRQYTRKIDGRNEAHLIAVVCGAPPEGHARWTLRLLADEFVALEQVDIDRLSYETIRRVLKKTNLSLGSMTSG